MGFDWVLVVGGDGFDHIDDVGGGFFEPFVGLVGDSSGGVGFDLVAVDDSFEGCTPVDDVAVGVGWDVGADMGLILKDWQDWVLFV